MLPIKTVLIEDVPDNLVNLKNMLRRYCPQVDVLGNADSVDSGFDLIMQQRPGLLILDIGIRRGTSFDILSRLQQADNLDFEVIFLTGEARYDYATRAFEYSAIDFLNKPIDPEKLCRAIEKAGQQLHKQQYRQQIEFMLTLLQQGTPRDTGRIALHLARGIIEFVDIKDLVRCEADGTVTWCFLNTNSRLAAMRNLGHYSELLVKDYNFFPISQSEIVNLAYVRRYNHAELSVTLTDGSVRYASRRGGQELRHYLNNSAQADVNQSDSLVEKLRQWFGR